VGLVGKILSVGVIMVAAVWGAWAFGSPAGPDMLIGEISSQDLQQAPYRTWYREHEDAYQVEEDSLSELAELMKGVDVTIIMGTWCHDSQRQVPQFYKILSRAGIPLARITMVAVDQQLMTPADHAAGLGITNTPTVIFYRDGKEVNRIVETPVISLEQDMTTILRGETYRHSRLLARMAADVKDGS